MHDGSIANRRVIKQPLIEDVASQGDMRNVLEIVANIQSTCGKHGMSHVVGLMDQITCDTSLGTHESVEPKGPYGLQPVGHFVFDGQKEMGKAREVGPPI